jgi:hypothetical protein
MLYAPPPILFSSANVNALIDPFLTSVWLLELISPVVFGVLEFLLDLDKVWIISARAICKEAGITQALSVVPLDSQIFSIFH